MQRKHEQTPFLCVDKGTEKGYPNRYVGIFNSAGALVGVIEMPQIWIEHE